MDNAMLALQPKRVWEYFAEINRIPRASKHEEKIIDYLVGVGNKLGLETIKDETGNVLIRKPASKGRENDTPVVFQGHMDMVCEKNNDTNFNFDTDPIQAYVDGEWVKAKGTTLGADDGIGLAIALALLEDKTISHPAMECLFTVDEETGLTGAAGLKPGFLKGKMLLNLDSEDEGQFFIGCAGGEDTVGKLAYKSIPAPKNEVAFKVTVKGLTGGHSGDDINKGRACANKVLNRLLYPFMDNMHISHIEGGNLRNAIAREAYAVITVAADKVDDFRAHVTKFDEEIRYEFRSTEPTMQVLLENAEMPSAVMDEDAQFKLMNLLYAIPHGVLAMSREIDNFVETSTNLASIRMEDGFITITTSQRSSVAAALKAAYTRVVACFKLVGAEAWHGNGYPGWAPNPESKILDIMVEAYKKLFNKEPLVLAIHAGLECGLIGETYPEMDMISYGPTLRGVHSPDEKLLIETVKQVWDLTVEVLKMIR